MVHTRVSDVETVYVVVETVTQTHRVLVAKRLGLQVGLFVVIFVSLPVTAVHCFTGAIPRAQLLGPFVAISVLAVAII